MEVKNKEEEVMEGKRIVARTEKEQKEEVKNKEEEVMEGKRGWFFFLYI